MVGLVYLLDESYTIYGGNIASTMAGEFSFSIALSFAMLAFGFFANGMQTGKHRIKAAICMALAILCHGIVAIYVAVGLILMAVLWLDRQRLRWFITTAGTGALLSAFWVGPFLLNHAYMTDMKYKGEPGNGSFTSYWGMFFALPPFWNVFIFSCAVIGFAAMVVKRNVAGIWLGMCAIVFAMFVFLFNDSLPIIGLLWNPRLLPMFNMCRYLLAAVGIIELVSMLLRLSQYQRSHLQGKVFKENKSVKAEQFRARTITAIVASVLTLLVLGFRFQVLPFGNVIDEGKGAEYTWGPFEGPAASKGFVDGWARWNFSGYEGRSSYGEYYNVVQAMKDIGETRGCGRALWENFSGNDKYGTTMALMLLPFWTDGCIGSSEGLFFEASGTTPYHFLAAGAMSKQSSNPVRELRYINNNPDVGVSYLQALGVNYYMAVTPEAIAKAEENVASGGGLSAMTQSGPWHIYAVAGSEIVTPLTVRPVVVTERSGDQRERWLEVGTSWLQNPSEWTAIPADDGPDEWQRVQAVIDLERREGEPGSDSRKVDVVRPTPAIEPLSISPAVVSDVVIGEESVSFSVDKIGVPILVRVSYFPNWEVSGAEGPYRVAPNMMVVIPTSQEVSMNFKPSLIDRLAYLLSGLGILALILMWRQDRRGKGQVAGGIGAEPQGPSEVTVPSEVSKSSPA